MIAYSLPDGQEITFEKEVIVTAVSVRPTSNRFVTLEFDNSEVSGFWSSTVTYLPHAIRAKRFKAIGGTIRMYIPEE